ncbi:hypothetical protein B0H13DRAFT_2283901 [Mycena leptocephala]|nr:hypothetical protein B0H13DRAFT_2283901 [Mycena leptocephala]
MCAWARNEKWEHFWVAGNVMETWDKTLLNGKKLREHLLIDAIRVVTGFIGTWSEAPRARNTGGPDLPFRSHRLPEFVQHGKINAFVVGEFNEAPHGATYMGVDVNERLLGAKPGTFPKCWMNGSTKDEAGALGIGHSSGHRIQRRVREPVKRAGVGRDRCTVTMYADVHLRGQEERRKITQTNGSHLTRDPRQLALLIVFSVPPHSHSHSRSPSPRASHQSPALVCVEPGPLGQPYCGAYCCCCGCGAGDSHAGGGGGGPRARAGVDIDSG